MVDFELNSKGDITQSTQRRYEAASLTTIPPNVTILGTVARGGIMPTISMFYGILVTILFEDNHQHHLPHIHVRYQGSRASVSIEDGRVLAG